MSQKGPVMIHGARSDIALACAHAFAADGHPIQLAARGAENLETTRADIALRHGVEVSIHEFDALASDTHTAFINGLEMPQVVISAVG